MYIVDNLYTIFSNYSNNIQVTDILYIYSVVLLKADSLSMHGFDRSEDYI